MYIQYNNTVRSKGPLYRYGIKIYVHVCGVIKIFYNTVYVNPVQQR